MTSAYVEGLISIINALFALSNGLLSNWAVLSVSGPPTLTAKGYDLINGINNIVNFLLIEYILPFLDDLFKAIALT